MVKIYLIIASFGKWDDWRTEVVGVYTTAEDADENKRKYKAHIEMVKTKNCPLTNDEIKKYYDGDLDKKKEAEYDRYISEHQPAVNFNSVWVEEREINKLNLP